MYNILLSTSMLANQKLARAVADGQGILSTHLGSGGADRGWPRVLDLYATTSASGVRQLFVCLGVWTPIALKHKQLLPQSAFALGIQVAVIANGRNQHAARTVEWRAAGKALEKGQETPVFAHALAESNLLFRRIDSVEMLSAITGERTHTYCRHTHGEPTPPPSKDDPPHPMSHHVPWQGP